MYCDIKIVRNASIRTQVTVLICENKLKTNPYHIQQVGRFCIFNEAEVNNPTSVKVNSNQECTESINKHRETSVQGKTATRKQVVYSSGISSWALGGLA